MKTGLIFKCLHFCSGRGFPLANDNFQYLKTQRVEAETSACANCECTFSFSTPQLHWGEAFCFKWPSDFQTLILASDSKPQNSFFSDSEASFAPVLRCKVNWAKNLESKPRGNLTLRYFRIWCLGCITPSFAKWNFPRETIQGTLQMMKARVISPAASVLLAQWGKSFLYKEKR